MIQLMPALTLSEVDIRQTGEMTIETAEAKFAANAGDILAATKQLEVLVGDP